MTDINPDPAGVEPTVGNHGRRVAFNALNPFIAQVATKVLMLGYLVAQYRLVGGEAGGALGDYFLAGTLYLYTSTISEWGLGTLLTREAAKISGSQGEVLSSTFSRTLSLRLLISLLLFVPTGLYVGIYAALFDLTAEGAWATVILSLSLLPAALSGSVTALLYARERMTLPALIGIGTALLNVVLGVGALFAGLGVMGLAGAAFVSTVVTAVLFLRILGRDFPEAAASVRLHSLRLRREWTLPLLRAGLPLMLNALLVGLFFRADGFIIRASEGGGALERYNAAYGFLSFVLLITPAVTLALFPRMARHAETDRPRLLLEYRFALKLLLMLSAPIVALTFWFAPMLITAVTGGKEGYLPDSAVVLQVLIFFLPLSFANGLTQYVLIALDRQQLLTGAFAVTALFNIAANLVLVPLMGINGAALATIASEVVLLVPFVYWVQRELGGINAGEIALKPAIAGLLLVPAAWLMGGIAARWNAGWGDFATYFAGGLLLLAVYAAALFVLRPFGEEESGMLRRAARRG